MALRSTLKSIKAMRLTLMAGVLLLAVLVATPANNLALAASRCSGGGGERSHAAEPIAPWSASPGGFQGAWTSWSERTS